MFQSLTVFDFHRTYFVLLLHVFRGGCLKLVVKITSSIVLNAHIFFKILWEAWALL